jgi:hypothetical protein
LGVLTLRGCASQDADTEGRQHSTLSGTTFKFY